MNVEDRFLLHLFPPSFGDGFIEGKHDADIGIAACGEGLGKGSEDVTKTACRGEGHDLGADE